MSHLYTARTRRGLALITRAGIGGLVEGRCGELDAKQLGDVERALAWVIECGALTDGQVAHLSRLASELASSRGRGVAAAPAPSDATGSPSPLPTTSSPAPAAASGQGGGDGDVLAWSECRGGLRTLELEGGHVVHVLEHYGKLDGSVISYTWALKHGREVLRRGLEETWPELEDAVEYTLHSHRAGGALPRAAEVGVSPIVPFAAPPVGALLLELFCGAAERFYGHPLTLCALVAVDVLITAWWMS